MGGRRGRGDVARRDEEGLRTHANPLPVPKGVHPEDGFQLCIREALDQTFYLRHDDIIAAGGIHSAIRLESITELNQKSGI